MSTNTFTRAEIEQIVIMERLHLYNRGIPWGAKAIRNRLQQEGICPVPSSSTIKRILSRSGLTHGRTGHYPRPRLLYLNEKTQWMKKLFEKMLPQTHSPSQNKTLSCPKNIDVINISCACYSKRAISFGFGHVQIITLFGGKSFRTKTTAFDLPNQSPLWAAWG